MSDNRTDEVLSLMRQHDVSSPNVPRGSIVHATAAVATACANKEITEAKARQLQRHIWTMYQEQDIYEL